MNGAEDEPEGWPVVPSPDAYDVLGVAAAGTAEAFSAFIAMTVAISEAHEMGIQPPGARPTGVEGQWTIDLPHGWGIASYTYTGKPPTIVDQVVMPGLDEGDDGADSR
ncbi:hypothetical protein [Streptomyces albireticuli]|uniref:Uncharacterized protein n=1 Tax=Streptomyces albireticuli TaxID=1940 RepID=A0A2A2D952_9ACTN|nr:hypothetical protein [Streptomyces albireticuli]MCD9145907.1 hypothetical protein [Streptomyces albireticuli]MCD9166077.1 hypothetical protein [Streptomyces albireticuli]MCD9196357.1 hypothetical protein [Streptomyces albireticuli]PAU47977.1 hypothetical protein CK936_15825 [Streptomyces albireticuli]